MAAGTQAAAVRLLCRHAVQEKASAAVSGKESVNAAANGKENVSVAANGIMTVTDVRAIMAPVSNPALNPGLSLMRDVGAMISSFSNN